jgi:uncharacterized protein
MDDGGGKPIDFSEITNFDTLQLLISDLSRRLENANNTIDAQKRISKNSVAVAERCRRHLAEASTNLRLELAKSDSQGRQKTKQEEANNYEVDKKKMKAIEENLRMTRIDFEMTGEKPLMKKIDKLKAELEVLAKKQEQQKRFLTHAVEMEKITEELSSAAQSGDLKACSLLLKRGASLNDVDSAGFLPIHYACKSGASDVVKLLCEFGQDPTSYLSGHSAVEIAARHGHTKVVHVLLSFGASVEDTGSNGRAPILSAVMSGNIECVQDLLSAGASITAVDTKEDTVLHTAVVNLTDPVDMVRFLLRNGADPTVRNSRGLAPLDLALSTRNGDLIKLLSVRDL